MMRKIYTSVTIDIATGEVEHEECFLYAGPVTECKGGGGGDVDSVDEEYNRRMADIYEAQQRMAEEYYDYWGDVYKPMEMEQVAANRQLIPYQTEQALAETLAATRLAPSNADLTLAQNQAALGLLPQQTALARETMADTSKAISEFAPVRAQYATEAAKGIDIDARVTQAKADVAGAFAGQTAANNRSMARMGVNPNSGAFADMSRQTATSRAKALGGAANTARTNAENENFNRLHGATQLGLSFTR
jgi:hypothetical protein